MMEVLNRNRQTLEEAIIENILPDTHIISDGWASYNQIVRINGGTTVKMF